MDSLIGLIDQVIPGSPVLAILTAVALLAAGWIARRAARSMQRQGARVGTLERTTRLERSRRRQVEQCLREQGIRLPYWPDDPAELYAAYSGRGPWPEDGVPLPHDHDAGEYPPEVEPPTGRVDTPAFSRHRLDNTRRNAP